MEERSADVLTECLPFSRSLHRSYKVESSIRHFISNIEFVKYVKYAHPFPAPFNGIRRCVNMQEVKTAQLEGVLKTEAEEEDIDDDWKKTVYTTAFWIGVAVEKKSGINPPPPQPRLIFYLKKKFITRPNCEISGFCRMNHA